MRRQLFILSLVAVVVSFWLAAKATQSFPTMVTVDGGQTRMLVAGDRGPVVVLDTFGEVSLDYWGTIQWKCAPFCRAVTYDHRDTGGSDAGPKPRDARQIATELHALLHAAKLPPPYVLVGYSFGGPYSRVFADLYPDEVCGLVLLDPSQEECFDWIKVHRPDLNIISSEEETKQTEYGCTWRSLNEARAAKVPAIPVTLVTAMRAFGESDPRIRQQWLQSHQHWINGIPGARHVITERSDHGIIFEEPDFVVRTIREMVERTHSGKPAMTHADR